MTPRPRTPPSRTQAAASAVRLSEAEIAFVRSLVIYEDAEVIAFDKPAGLSSQGGRAGVNTLDELLWAFAKSSGNRPRLVHRLDRDTSGVILTARTKPAAAFLGKAMMARRFAKTYHALVAPSAAAPATGAIEAPLRREDVGREAYMRVCAADHPQAESARTRFKVLARTADAALLELSPDTGRMHQIRVHLAHAGCPILGDARYGGSLAWEGVPLPRTLLHARALVFPHPGGGSKRIESEWPQDLAGVASRLGLACPPRIARPSA